MLFWKKKKQPVDDGLPKPPDLSQDSPYLTVSWLVLLHIALLTGITLLAWINWSLPQR